MIAYLFDLDGVIVDSMPLHMQAWEAYLTQHGIPARDLRGRMHGRRNDEIVRVFWGDQLTPHENFAHGEAKEALYRQMMEPVFNAHLVPGAVEFVRSLNGRPAGLGSNAERANIDFTLHHAGLAEAFRAVVDGNQVDRPKPNPDIYLRLAAELGVSAAACVVFEDSVTGVSAARAAGMRVVGIDTGRVGLENVDLRVDDFRDPRLGAFLASLGA
jgi:HAD superfamily hydrolase (TIGR01509 family)